MIYFKFHFFILMLINLELKIFFKNSRNAYLLIIV